jgi:hypothetical protein
MNLIVSFVLDEHPHTKEFILKELDLHHYNNAVLREHQKLLIRFQMLRLGILQNRYHHHCFHLSFLCYHKFTLSWKTPL